MLAKCSKFKIKKLEDLEEAYKAEEWVKNLAEVMETNIRFVKIAIRTYKIQGKKDPKTKAKINSIKRKYIEEGRQLKTLINSAKSNLKKEIVKYIKNN